MGGTIVHFIIAAAGLMRVGDNIILHGMAHIPVHSVTGGRVPALMADGISRRCRLPGQQNENQKKFQCP